MPTPIRIVVPSRNTPAPAISTPVPAKSTPAPGSSTDPAPGAAKAGDGDKSKEQEADKPAAKKAKGPTIITSRQAKFDQKANIGIFIGDVFVDDPDFKVHCDKLTAYLMHDDTPKPAAGTPGKPGVKPPATPAATPAPVPGATPGVTAPGATPEPAAKKKGSGLRNALAEASPGQRVLINQDKVEDDGTITHGIGRADKATYDAITGDVVLYGSPEVFQGPKSVVAVDPDAIITLNRDGHMHTQGMTKTTIDNAGDAR